MAQTEPDEARNRSRRHGRTRPEQLPMYQAALEEARSALEIQSSELDSMRQRAIQFLAFIGTATAFLVGSGIQAEERTNAFHVLAIIGTCLSAISILAVIVVMTGLHGLKKSEYYRWNFGNSAGVLINGWIEAEVGPKDEVDYIRAIALEYDEMAELNKPCLRNMRVAFILLVIAGFCQVMVWAALVWYSR